MEFHASVPLAIAAKNIQAAISISDLPKFCASIFEVMRDDGEQGEINCLWGVFLIRREAIKGGVRFTLPHCPNALAWTVTAGLQAGVDVVNVHCTIPGSETDPDFRDSIDEFIEHWREGLESAFS